MMAVSNIINMGDDMNEYAAYLRKRRLQLGYSQYKLAAKIGISQPFLNQIEMQTKKPSIDVFFALCEALDIEVKLVEKSNE